MDLLLINPPYFDQQEMDTRYQNFISWIKKGNMYIVPFEPPLGLASLVSFLKERGITAELLDIPGMRMDELQLKDLFLKKRPDCIGITAMSTTLFSAFRIARIAKSVLPEIKVITGGIHPTLEPKQVLQNSDIDYVVRGEGEFALESILSSISSHGLPEIEGVCFRSHGEYSIGEKARLITDIDSLPFPDYSSFPIDAYIQYNENLRGIKGISMLVSRGCPYHCSFCSVKSTMGTRYRIKSPRKVVDEMEFLRYNFQLEGIWFKDSILNLKSTWVEDFCREIKRRNLNLIWQCNTRVDLVHEDEIRLMAESGLAQLDLGIESGSVKSLSVLKKGYTIEQIQQAVAIAKKYVRVAGFFMIGIPGETERDIDETFNLARSLKLDRYCFSMFIPLPGSELYHQLSSEGKIDGEENLKDLHFTLCRKSYCEIPPERLSERYREINDYFSKG
jgi:radical SAM superfamily enzyme YgiQ (UPF0313 family)